jgi:uncharacterized protein with PhoU and TrkA domain
MDPFEGVDTQAVEYEPVGVKTLLVDMKNSSELIVDLAYSALLHSSDELAEEVLRLESEMDVLQMRARMNMLMAARTTEDSKQLAPVLGMVGAAEKLSEAAGDIAHVVLDEDGLPGAIRAALPDATEVLARAELAATSEYAGQTLGEIDLETETGVRVIALRRGDDWTLDPTFDTRLLEGDSLLLRGAEDNLAAVYETVARAQYESAGAVDHDTTDLARAVDSIVLMKNVSELSVDLAYASVLFDDEQLAAEVHDLEVEVDSLQARLEAWTLRAAGELDDPVSLRGLLRLAASTELISDAALEITEGILRDIDTHPVIAESVRESDVAVRRARVAADGHFDGATVRAVGETCPGVSVIAVHTADDEWELYPDDEEPIAADDVLIARGTWDATEHLVRTVGA